MNECPNIESTISEIMGAITLRVIWAILKSISAITIAYCTLFGAAAFITSHFKLENADWHPALKILFATIFIWAYIYQATRYRSFHIARFYFPKTNGLTSFLISFYIVTSISALYAMGSGFINFVFGYILSLIPIIIYYTLNCGYYLVMMRRHPNYEYEDFAITMPSVLFELSLKQGGINGVDDDF